MKITCESCGAKYTIADDKVSGRKVKIRCKGCGTPIVVDGAAKAGGAPANTDANPVRTDSQIPVEPAPSSAPPAGEWSVNLSETDQRTMSTDELVRGWQSGAVTTDAFVWKEGMGDWLPILECAELTALLNAAPAAAEPKPAAQPAARAAVSTRPVAAARTGGRVQVGTDLFSGAAASDSEGEDVNTSAPVLPQGARGDDGKPTGQRNENSVLFSLDALKAGFAGPPAKAEAPKRGATARGTAADDPFGLGGGAVAAAPMFSMADNAALLTAPPPPEPPKPVIAFAQPGAPAEARSKKGMIIGVVAVLLVGGIGAAFALSAKAETEEALKVAAAAAASAEKARDDERKARAAEEKAREEQKEEAAKATAAAVAAAEAAAKSNSDSKSAGDDTKKDDKKDAAAPTGKAGSTAAKKDDKKDEAPAAPAGGDQPFNKSAAQVALSSAAGSAGSCKKLGGPTGSGKVKVTFAPSGRVTTANVEGGSFAGTSVGSCVASIFRKAKVPPFTGSALTVSKSFTIN